MKRFIILSIYSFIILQGCLSTNIPLDSIKCYIVSFYKEMDPKFNQDISVDDFPDFLTYDRKSGAIKEGKEGVFAFGLLMSGELTHFLLVEKHSFEILNMNDPLEENLLKLSDFLRRNKRYSKQDVLFYIEDVIKTHKYNVEYIESFNGIIL